MYPCDPTYVVCQIKLTDVIIISMSAAESGVEVECAARAKIAALELRTSEVGTRLPPTWATTHTLHRFFVLTAQKSRNQL